MKWLVLGSSLIIDVANINNTNKRTTPKLPDLQHQRVAIPDPEKTQVEKEIQDSSKVST